VLPSGCGCGAVEPLCAEPQCGGDDALAASPDLHLGQARRARLRGDLLRRHGHGAPQPEHPQLRQAGQQLGGSDRPSLNGDIGDAQHAAGTQHSVTLGEERLQGAEVERCLHADDPVHGLVGDRQPDGVARHRHGPGLPEPVFARRQLPLGDVHRHQPARPGRLGDHAVLGTEPIAHIQDHPPGGQG
jgi:hypothetical protein